MDSNTQPLAVKPQMAKSKCLMVAVVACLVSWRAKSFWCMWLKISMLSTLSFCLMSRMRINLFLYMRKVKRCKPSSIVVKRKTKKRLPKCSSAARHWSVVP
ncbi:Uncharacterised protein [Vibrio cholerae]|nr:Uncharacterised protein [Vibrio cholerae]